MSTTPSDHSVPTPSHLFHYTRMPGLLSIPNDRAIRATSIHCLNDPTECLYAFRIAWRILRQLDNQFPGLASAIGHALEARLKTCHARLFRLA